IPAFYVRGVRRFVAAGDRNVTILCKREKRRFAGQSNRRGPIRGKPDKSRTGQIQRENGVAIGAVQVQTEKCEPQRTCKKKMLILVLAIVKDLKRPVKSRNFPELRFGSRFQITQHVMLSVAGTIDL